MFAGVSKRSWQKAREHQNKAALYGRRTADGGCPYIVLQEFRMSEALADKKCVPCRGGVPPLKGEELKKLHDSIPEWEVVSEHHLHREFRFPDFK